MYTVDVVSGDAEVFVISRDVLLKLAADYDKDPASLVKCSDVLQLRQVDRNHRINKFSAQESLLFPNRNPTRESYSENMLPEVLHGKSKVWAVKIPACILIGDPSTMISTSYFINVLVHISSGERCADGFDHDKL